MDCLCRIENIWLKYYQIQCIIHIISPVCRWPNAHIGLSATYTVPCSYSAVNSPLNPKFPKWQTPPHCSHGKMRYGMVRYFPTGAIFRGTHQPPGNSHYEEPMMWRFGVFGIVKLFIWTICWTNNRIQGDLRHNDAHMSSLLCEAVLPVSQNYTKVWS